MTEYLNIDINIHEYVLDRYYETVFLDVDRLQSYARFYHKSDDAESVQVMIWLKDSEFFF